MLKFPCLILDHDDTVVDSESTINFPAFRDAMAIMHPDIPMTRREYTLWIFREGFLQMCENHFHLIGAEFDRQYDMWKRYVMTHIPPAFPGIKELLQEYRRRGGLICVSSHSSIDNIRRDYETHFDLLPDEIYGWELGEAERKPAPYTLQHIMEIHGFSPDQLLMVDDLDPGLKMAHSCGVAFGWAGWGRKDFPEIKEYMEKESDYSFSTIDDLKKILFES